ncbi:MAG: MarR family transcriptional regulator [Candidatus Caldarchaeum sp.]
MVFSRVLLVFSAAAGILLLTVVLVSVWQHDAAMGGMMREMMGVSMWGMMWWVYLPLLVAALLLIALPVVLYLSGRDVPVVAGLTAEERAVVDLLRRSNGVVEQREIARALGISRIKTHRIVASLRRREVVEVTRRGRTNLVKLKASPQP